MARPKTSEEGGRQAWGPQAGAPRLGEGGEGRQCGIAWCRRGSVAPILSQVLRARAERAPVWLRAPEGGPEVPVVELG